MFAPLLFFFLAVVAVAAALGMLISRNPVTSALWLILNLFCIAGIYLTLNAQFIAVVQVMVYAGAIMVLFLFVIMLLNLTTMPKAQHLDWKPATAFVLGMALMAQLVYAVALGLGVAPEVVPLADVARNGAASTLAVELFTRYALPLEMIGILLLVATVGAVLLAKRTLT